MNRFIVLDGIRGIAALFVITRHTRIFWGHDFFRSYLAVDLFFILSGFVIAYAYEEKLKNKTISLKNFLLIRLIRLYPVYIFSLILSTLALIAPLVIHRGLNAAAIFDICNLTFMAALFLPTQVAGNLNLFPINPVYWSLFFELIANLLYAVTRPYLSNKVLLLAVIISEIMVVASANYNGNLDIGFTWETWAILAGLFRSIFGFFLGILLYRCKDTTPSLQKKYKELMPYITILIICIILSSPSADKLDFIIDIIIVTTVFPTLVILASQGKSKVIEPSLSILGSASYPIYLIHIPIGHIISGIFKEHIVDTTPISGTILTLSLISFSVWLEKAYDLPIRRLLSNKISSRISR
ncbi:acyltransferase family protein [Methylomonas sp. MK1]|uniref:acyltransferase family protein n=1 Tax=Methylomonas sp. MK1 TaxID=1131552 RepID=UPI00036056D9|nr:acyltransferase [Methylomonas sp. MK1]